jgi:Domain of unknown function (DUF5605)
LPRTNRDDPHELAGGMKFHVDVLDTWNMTATPIDQTFTIRQPVKTDYFVFDEADSTINLPGNPWLALRVTRLSDQ